MLASSWKVAGKTSSDPSVVHKGHGLSAHEKPEAGAAMASRGITSF
jgi:hypothetical protein